MSATGVVVVVPDGNVGAFVNVTVPFKVVVIPDLPIMIPDALMFPIEREFADKVSYEGEYKTLAFIFDMFTKVSDLPRLIDPAV